MQSIVQCAKKIAMKHFVQLSVWLCFNFSSFHSWFSSVQFLWFSFFVFSLFTWFIPLIVRFLRNRSKNLWYSPKKGLQQNVWMGGAGCGILHWHPNTRRISVHSECLFSWIQTYRGVVARKPYLVFLHILQERLLKVCSAICHNLRKARFYQFSTFANIFPTLGFRNKNKKRSFLSSTFIPFYNASSIYDVLLFHFCASFSQSTHTHTQAVTYTCIHTHISSTTYNTRHTRIFFTHAFQ